LVFLLEDPGCPAIRHHIRQEKYPECLFGTATISVMQEFILIDQYMYTKMLYIPLEAEKTGRNCTLIMMKAQRKITL